MTVLHSVLQQAAAEAQAAAQRNATPQGGKPVKSTVFRDGKNTITITEDQHGNKTITGAGASDWLPVLQNLPDVPGGPTIATTVPPMDVDIPPRAVDLAYAFFLMIAVIVVGWPIARAFGRRVERKAEIVALPPATADQLRRIEQAVEAMAIEVERISESQRFMAKLRSGATAERV